ncbi:MAG: hypothetical protein ACOYT8_02870 [Candidatus Dependentiae bacterium]
MKNNTKCAFYLIFWVLISIPSILLFSYYYDLGILHVLVFFLLPVILASLVKLDLADYDLKIKLSGSLVLAGEFVKFITRYLAVKLGLAPLKCLYYNWFDFSAPVIKQLVYIADYVVHLGIKFVLFYSALTFAAFLQKKLRLWLHN